MTVPAAELRAGDRIRMIHYAANINPTDYPELWQVLAPPVRLAQTRDVTVHVGIRSTDPGVHLRIPADEEVEVARDR